MILKTFLLLASATVCQGWWWSSRDQSDWNGLKVKWGVNPFRSFDNVPRTVSDAVREGWINMSPYLPCDGNPLFRGERYWKGSDMTVILLFDTAGYIAGIQAGFSKDDSANYPTRQVLNKPIVLDGNNYFITAYFVDPATLCNGRTASEFETDGTGTGLWIQNGTNPVTNSVRMPDRQEDADNTLWTEGACFPSMGKHYWYNLRADMDCDEFFPVFLMYNDGVLNSFGWAFGTNLRAPRYTYEHPLRNSYGYFMTTPPQCLNRMGTLSTLHIYLTNSAFANTC